MAFPATVLVIGGILPSGGQREPAQLKIVSQSSNLLHLDFEKSRWKIFVWQIGWPGRVG